MAIAGGGFIAQSKRLRGVDLVEISPADRDAKTEAVAARFLAAGQAAGMPGRLGGGAVFELIICKNWRKTGYICVFITTHKHTSNEPEVKIDLYSWFDVVDLAGGCSSLSRSLCKLWECLIVLGKETKP